MAIGKIHSLVVIAAISVIILSAAGIGVMTGTIPSSFSNPETVQSSEDKAAISAAEQKVLDPTKQQSTTKNEAPAPVNKKIATAPKKIAAAEPAPAPVPKVCEICGTVTGVEEVKEQGEGTGIGAVGGGVAGAVIGNQIGDGTTRKIATVAGAAAGAYGGHQAEKYIRSTTRYDVTVHMDDGTYRTISDKTDPALRPGDKIKIEHGVIVRN
ncbi:MAG: glycine zipper 2TM domain-containing protein [Burkholderiales bacterium]